MLSYLFAGINRANTLGNQAWTNSRVTNVNKEYGENVVLVRLGQ